MLCETGSQLPVCALLFMSFFLCVLVKDQQSITMIHVNNNVKLLNDSKYYNKPIRFFFPFFHFSQLMTIKINI